MPVTFSRTHTSTTTATETRVRAVLRQVNVDLLAAVAADLVNHSRAAEWYQDLSYMLNENAIEHFEIRVQRGDTPVGAWRYVVRDDGSLMPSNRGGGINFCNFVASSDTVHVVITRRSGLPDAVSKEIDRRGWTVPMAALSGSLIQERIYSKDGYGVVRHRIDCR